MFKMLSNVKENKITLNLMGILLFVMPLLALSMVYFKLDNVPRANYEEIILNGVEVEGVVTSLDINTKTVINGKSPMIVSYEYSVGDENRTDRVETIDPIKFKVEDSVKVKYLGDYSTIVGVKVSEFPFYILYIVFGAFIPIGLGLLLYVWLKK